MILFKKIKILYNVSQFIQTERRAMVAQGRRLEAEKTVGQDYRQAQGDFGGDEHADYLDHSQGCKLTLKCITLHTSLKTKLQG